MVNEEDQGGRRATSMRIEHKLTQGDLFHEAWTLMRGGSSSSVNRVLKIARQHPVPAAIISLGLGWLVYEGIRDDEREVAGRRVAGDLADSARSTASDVAESVRRQVSDVGRQASGLSGQARVAVRQTQAGFWEMLEKQPRVMGAATLAAGLLVVLLRRRTARG